MASSSDSHVNSGDLTLESISIPPAFSNLKAMVQVLLGSFCLSD